MKGLQFDEALALLAAVSITNRKRPPLEPPKTRDVFVESADGRIYYIDGKGTRRKATEEEAAAFKAGKS